MLLWIVMAVSSLPLVRGGGPCIPKAHMARKVPLCPSNTEEVELAARTMNCSRTLANKRCHSVPKYHCLLNAELNMFFELCSEEINIVGQLCAVYDEQFDLVRANYETHCHNRLEGCPEFYKSTDTYKYCYCYKRELPENGTKPTTKLTNQTMPTASTKPKEEEKESETSHILYIILILVGVLAVFVAVVFLRNTRKKIIQNCKSYELRSTGQKDDKTHEEEFLFDM